MKKKIVFMGSPAFAVPALQALHKAGAEVVAVYSQPPRAAGRGQKKMKTPVHEAAEALGLKVSTPEKLQGADLDALMALDAEVFCVVGYGLLLPKVVVEGRVCVNVHPSALPRWRGATPVQSALMAGDTQTEVCVMRLDAGMDTGPVYARAGVKIHPDMDAGQLNARLWAIGSRMLVEVVKGYKTMTPVPQAGEATRAFKITGEMRRIDWKKSAAEVHNLVRALAPSPGAVAELDGEAVKILKTEVVERAGTAGVLGEGCVVGCGAGSVRLVTVQRAGKKAMGADEAARGWGALAAGGAFAV